MAVWLIELTRFKPSATFKSGFSAFYTFQKYEKYASQAIIPTMVEIHGNTLFFEDVKPPTGNDKPIPDPQYSHENFIIPQRRLPKFFRSRLRAHEVGIFREPTAHLNKFLGGIPRKISKIHESHQRS